MATPNISIFYPCYNDWATMASMVLYTIQTAERLNLNYDITIVDDGSPTIVQELLDDLERRFDCVQIVRHPNNRGYGAALRTGFAAATKDWVFYTDGDAQYDVRELTLLVEHARPDVDVVQGYKISRHDPIHRIVIGRIYHWIVKLAFGLRLRDVDCDFRLMRRSIFEGITLESDSGVICAEMMTKVQRAGFHIVEVPVHHYQRAHGKSQFFNFRRILRVATQLTTLWYREVFTRRFRPERSTP